MSQEALWTTITLTLKLASLTTVILLVLAIPLAWWLSQTQSMFKTPVLALVTLPVVLPPTVLGFYLLILMGPAGPVGQLTQWLWGGYLPFTFAGLLVGSVIFSLPFAIQPLFNAFVAQGRRPLEVAATLRASPIDGFFSVTLPSAKPAIVTAALLCFAHTLGEFGIVLMIGGNIPGETRVLSMEIYGRVEALDYVNAHYISAGLLVFSFLILVLLQVLRTPPRGRWL